MIRVLHRADLSAKHTNNDDDHSIGWYNYLAVVVSMLIIKPSLAKEAGNPSDGGKQYWLRPMRAIRPAASHGSQQVYPLSWIMAAQDYNICHNDVPRKQLPLLQKNQGTQLFQSEFQLERWTGVHKYHPGCPAHFPIWSAHHWNNLTGCGLVRYIIISQGDTFILWWNRHRGNIGK